MIVWIGWPKSRTFLKCPITEDEIRNELPSLFSGYEPGMKLVKSPLEPRYHKGNDLWKLFAAEDRIIEERMEEEDWELGEEQLLYNDIPLVKGGGFVSKKSKK